MLCEVAHRFGDKYALKNISLSIERGERVAIIGPSGSGKSTLLNLMQGVLEPTKGQVFLKGHLLQSAKLPFDIRQKVGKMPQDNHLVGRLAVVHNLNGGRLADWPFWKSMLSLLFPQDLEPLKEMMKTLGLPEALLFQRTEELSGGEQKRIALGRVLLQRADLIFADEPVASVDPERARSVLSLLCAADERGRTLVASLHEVDLARTFFDRIIGLREGRIIFDLPRNEIQATHFNDLYRLEDTLS